MHSTIVNTINLSHKNDSWVITNKILPININDVELPVAPSFVHLLSREELSLSARAQPRLSKRCMYSR